MPNALFPHLLLLLVATDACAMSPTSVRTWPPSIERITLASATRGFAKLAHRRLPDVPIDSRNGFNPGEIALLAVGVNPVLRTARDERGLVRAQIVAAGILPNPTLSLDSSIPVAGKTEGNLVSYSAQVSWSLNQLFLRAPLTTAANRNAERVELDIAWAEWKVAMTAQRLAQRLLLLHEANGIHRKNISDLTEMRFQVQKATRKGSVIASHLIATNAALSQARAASAMNQREIAVGVAQLQGLLGGLEHVATNIVSDAQPSEDDSSITLAPLLQGLPARRPDLRALSLAMQSNDAKYRAATRRSFPTINIGVQIVRDSGDYTSIGPSLQVGLPFFRQGGGMKVANRAESARLVDLYSERINQARQNIAVAFARFSGSIITLSLLDTAIAEQEKLLSLYTTAITRGEVNIFVYYAARSTLVELRLLRVSERIEQAEAKFILRAESGQYSLSNRQEVHNAK